MASAINLIPSQHVNTNSAPVGNSPSAQPKVTAAVTRVNPFVSLAKKIGITEDETRGYFRRMEETYASSTLTQVCSVEIMRKPVKVDELLTAFNITQEEFNGFFHYSPDNKTCTVEYKGEILAIVTGKDQVEARENATNAVLSSIHKHPVFFVKFLVKVPQPVQDRHARREVALAPMQEFVQKHTTNQLSFGILAYFQQINVWDTTTFTSKKVYKLKPEFDHIPIPEGIVEADSKSKAERALATKMLNIFETTVQNPKEIYFNTLVSIPVIRFFESISFTKALVPIILEYAREIPAENYFLTNTPEGEKNLDKHN